MRLFPIIPLWLMVIICFLLMFFLFWREKEFKKKIKQIFIIILLFIINMRIMFPSKGAMNLTNNLDVLFVIDNTLSMVAEDYQNNKTRMEGVKEDCKYIIEELAGARFSVIVFNNSSQIIIPYTKDANIAIESIDIIHPLDELYAKGTSLDVPLEDMQRVLESSKEKDDAIRIVFYISDGEINSDNAMQSFKPLKKIIDNGAVLGYGTSKGGYMKVYDYFTEEAEYLEDRDEYPYQKAVSKLDETTLNKIAKELGVDYINVNSSKTKLINKITELKKMSKNKYQKNDLSSYTDTYYWFVIPLLILFVLSYRDYRKIQG